VVQGPSGRRVWPGVRVHYPKEATGKRSAAMKSVHLTSFPGIYFSDRYDMDGPILGSALNAGEGHIFRGAECFTVTKDLL
jgi:hypothetical protein